MNNDTIWIKLQLSPRLVKENDEAFAVSNFKKYN